MRPPPRPSVKAIGPTKPQETEKGVSEPPSDLLTALKSGSAADPIQAVATASTQKNTAPAIASVKPTTRRPSKLRAPRKAAMHLTPAAVEQIRALLEGPDPKLLKVGVRNRGCSGLAYNLEYVGKPGAFDELVEQDGVRVLVDSKALFSIIGSEMDWVEDKLNQRFVFRNPNIKEQCGCGESFMV
ncbi:iron-sulfur cluster assembly accessory protein [Grosmannia clavigera kw1407]|uniref:Iron-sulfur assembly protein 1 n=1 Tax=Grosmannia clavigera (strain kw1407 / UAMH 11150) TaxID=655863 RepID=F0X7W1_GROCL|nr:iron-sulfur cluster assembly accessory protein [Grosmannia clavigera kw1407]EFX06462.1 iron-sulfur cluster assembly accessory protein [Grosmannia clavigera kw1407]